MASESAPKSNSSPLDLMKATARSISLAWRMAARSRGSNGSRSPPVTSLCATRLQPAIKSVLSQC